MAFFYRLEGCGTNLGKFFALSTGGFGGTLQSAVTTGNTIRLFRNTCCGWDPSTSLEGCWRARGVLAQPTVPPGYTLVPLLPVNYSPIVDYGPGDHCIDCEGSVIGADCDAENLTIYFGLFDLTDAGKVFKTSGGALPSCVQIFDATTFEVDAGGSMLGPIDLNAVSPTPTIFPKASCFDCLTAVKCIRLIDCATDGQILDYYIEDNIGSIAYPTKVSSLLGGVAQLIIPDYLVNEVTGVPVGIEFTSCFKIVSSSRDPGGSPGCAIENVLVNDSSATSCDNCSFCFDMVSCSNPSEVYLAYTVDNVSNSTLYELVLQCGSISRKSTIRIDLQDGNGYRCFEIKTPCTGLGQPLLLDLLVPLTYDLFCDDIPCTVCSLQSVCYLITFCELGQSIILQDPTIIGIDPAPIGNYYQGTLTLGDVAETQLTGCFTLSVASCSSVNPAPVTGAILSFDDSPVISYATCEDCAPPPCYIITRCDDPGVSFILNPFALTVDPAELVGKVIRNVTLFNCSTGPTPCFIKPEQCWLVELYGPATSQIVLTGYDTRPGQIFTDTPDMSGCACCLGNPYTPET